MATDHRIPRTERSKRIPREQLSQLHEKICASLEENLTTCHPDDWFSQYASNVRRMWNDENLEFVEGKLKEVGALSDIGWNAVLDSTAIRENKELTFAPIAEIAAQVVEVVHSKWPHLQTKTITKPILNEAILNEGHTSEVSMRTFKPDIRSIVWFPKERVDLRFLRRSGRIQEQKNTMSYKQTERLTSMNTSDTVIVGEIRKGMENKDVRDNELKLCGGATELLYNDPCRRFVNGFTIESCEMRMWRFERSHVCVSSFFNFHLHPRHLILFLLYITFGTPTELGYDPTVTRYRARYPKEGINHPKDERDYETVIAYCYQAGKRYFLTEGHPISESSAWNITSQSTRVWAAREIFFTDPKKEKWTDGETFVIKDVYLFEDATLEKDIKDAIVARLREFDNQQTPRTNHAKKAEDHFMTYVCDEVVKLPHEDKEWSTDDLTSVMTVTEPACFTSVEANDNVFVVPGSQRTSIRDTCKPSTDAKDSRMELNYRRRKHVRTVLKETCQSIYELPDWQTLIRCLIDIIEGLYLMRLAGYVHRDVSGGNCLWDVLGGKGKLADLEFARPYDHTTTDGHDSRTGTPEFMAAEYQQRAYFYYVNIRTRLKVKQLPFTFNYFHDLEPVFWIYVWSLFYHPPSQCISGRDPEETEKILRKRGSRWFECGIHGNQARTSIVTWGDHVEITNALEDVYTTASGGSVLLDGVKVVDVLKMAYTDLENDETPEVFPDQRPPLWRTELFTEHPYRDMQDILRGVLGAMHQGQNNKLDVYNPPPKTTSAARRAGGSIDASVAPVEKRARLA